MAAPVSKFIQQRAVAKAAGLNIVRKIFKTNEFTEGISTKHLYKLALQEPAPPDFEAYPLPRPPPPVVPKTRHGKSKIVVPSGYELYPPNPNHPIRSIRFMKEVLVTMKEAKEIGMFRQAKEGARLAAEEAVATTKRQRKTLAASQVEFVWKALPPQPDPKPAPVKEVVGREVGVGADISHLNKRRQRARVEKVSNSVEKMKALKNGGKARAMNTRPLYRRKRPTDEADL